MMLTPDIKKHIDQTVLCWLATVSKEGIPNVSPKEIFTYLDNEMDPSDLFHAIENGEAVVIIDTRQAFGYEKERIPKAVNIPHRTMNEATTSHLDTSKTYVCYCDGIGCNASTKGSLNMTKLGFKVKELIGGLEWWVKDGYATEGNFATDGTQIQCAC